MRLISHTFRGGFWRNVGNAYRRLHNRLRRTDDRRRVRSNSPCGGSSRENGRLWFAYWNVLAGAGQTEETAVSLEAAAAVIAIGPTVKTGVGKRTSAARRRQQWTASEKRRVFFFCFYDRRNVHRTPCTTRTTRRVRNRTPLRRHRMPVLGTRRVDWETCRP